MDERCSAVGSCSIVGWALPVLLALAACGGADPDTFGGAGGDGGAAATTSTSASATIGSSSSTGSASTTGSAPTSGGTGGTGGAAEGGGSSDGGGGSGSSQGGGGSEGGGGGARPAACDGGCVPSSDAKADCDEDGDPNAVDCQPCDPLVHHAQLDYFDVPYEPFGEGGPSFDYDCSGATELEYELAPDGCSSFTAQTCPEDEPVYVGAQGPLCGEGQTLQTCVVSAAVVGVAGSCTSDGPSSVVLVRCR